VNIQELTKHPELLNRETLYDLRRMTALYPYYQPARLLMIKNLYLLHDPSFDEELRRAAIYFTDRKILFNLVESAHYRLKHKSPQSFLNVPDRRGNAEAENGESRTVSLIDSFLSTIPEDEKPTKKTDRKDGKAEKDKRKPTAADATVDYVAYLLATDFEELNETVESTEPATLANTAMNGGALIDAFINNDNGRITLQEEPEYLPEVPIADNSEREPEDEYLTETLAGIYIKQGRYKKALDIMNRINNMQEKKNLYFDDQKRFLAKLIVNQKTK
jgi:hypothetical protein